MYVERLPRWSDEVGGYLDPDTGAVLPTWDETLDRLDDHGESVPAHVVRLVSRTTCRACSGARLRLSGRVQYLCKYLNKGIATTYDDDGDDMSPARAEHIDRPADEVRWLPCASSCANWLRFGVQPKNAAPEMVPGHCMHKAHDRAFTTWVHRVAVNHLLDRKRSAVERFELTVGAFAEDLHDGLAPIALNAGPELDLLAREVEHGCTLALLTCLDRESRVADVLGEVFGVASAEGAWICETSETAYRKRLSRARAAVRAFVAEHCGLVAPAVARCHCRKRVPAAVRLGRVDPAIAEHVTAADVEDAVGEMEALYDAAEPLRSVPDTAAREVAVRIRSLLASGRYRRVRPPDWPRSMSSRAPGR